MASRKSHKKVTSTKQNNAASPEPRAFDHVSTQTRVLWSDGIEEELDSHIRNEQLNVADMANIKPLTPSVVMDNLQNRFARDIIYTSVSEIIVSVNPYQYVESVFSQDLFDRFQYNVAEAAVRSLPPHLFHITRRAYRGAIGFDKGLVASRDQSILISGESGAGKTEASKLALRYFANMSARRAREVTNMNQQLLIASQEATFQEHQKEQEQAVRESALDKDVIRRIEPRKEEDVAEGGGEIYVETDLGESIEDKLISADPVLEAFGNAKTLRNDNSSRFGKFTSLQLNKQGIIVGGKITKYLLEESRVCTQQIGERNFNIYYQVMAGDGDADVYQSEKFNYLSRSGCRTIPGVDDRKRFGELVDALRCLQFGLDQRTAIFNVVKGILHLGNIDFEEKVDKKDKAKTELHVTQESKVHLNSVANLFSCDPGKGKAVDKANKVTAAQFAGLLEAALCRRAILMGRENITVSNTKLEAESFRDALAKTTHGYLMTWIVDQMNATISKQEDHPEGAEIGVLDIFGFEASEHNSFEQLCINYANEKLQQHFLTVLTAAELSLYKSEQLRVEELRFRDNTECVELLEQRPRGVFCALADALATNRTDESFVQSLLALHKDHPLFSTPRFATGKPEFVISHYAMAVTYDATGFMAKNQRYLGPQFTKLCNDQGSSLLQSMFRSQEGQSPTGPNPSPSPPAAKPQAKPHAKATDHSLGARFQQSLGALLNSLRKTNSHFIRCLKANANKEPKSFDRSEVKRQLITSGLLDAVQVRNMGYPNRLEHPAFVGRYWLLLRSRWSPFHDPQLASTSESLELIAKVRLIMAAVERAEQASTAAPGNAKGTPQKVAADWQAGQTLVFYRSNIFTLLAAAREKVVEHSVAQLQRRLRGKSTRRKYRPQLVAWHEVARCLEEQRWADGSFDTAVVRARQAGVDNALLSRVLLQRDRTVDIQNQQQDLLSSLLGLLHPQPDATLQSAAKRLADLVVQAQEASAMYQLQGADLQNSPPVPKTTRVKFDEFVATARTWMTEVAEDECHPLCWLVRQAAAVAAVLGKAHTRLSAMQSGLSQCAPTAAAQPTSARVAKVLSGAADVLCLALEQVRKLPSAARPAAAAAQVSAAVSELAKAVVGGVREMEAAYAAIGGAMAARQGAELSNALRLSANLLSRKSPAVQEAVKCLALITVQEEADAAVARRDPVALEKLQSRLNQLTEAAAGSAGNAEWADWVQRLQHQIDKPLHELRQSLGMQRQLQTATLGRNLKQLRALLQEAAAPPHNMAEATHPVFKDAVGVRDELEARRVIEDCFAALDDAAKQPLDQIEFLYALAMSLSQQAGIPQADAEVTKLMVWRQLETAARGWGEEDGEFALQAAIAVAKKLCPAQLAEPLLEADQLLRKAEVLASLRFLAHDPYVTAKSLAAELQRGADAGLSAEEMEFATVRLEAVQHETLPRVKSAPFVSLRGSRLSNALPIPALFKGESATALKKPKKPPPAPADFNPSEKLADLVSAHGVVRKLNKDVTPAGGWLFAVVHSCSNLAPVDAGALNDTYCVLRVGTDIQKTSVQAKTLNPEFQELFRFPIKDLLHQQLRVLVKSKKWLKRDVQLGSICIDVADVARMSTQGLGNKGVTKRKLHRAWQLAAAERGEIELTLYYVEKLHDKPQFGIECHECARVRVDGLPGKVPAILVTMEQFLVDNGAFDEVGIFRLAPDADQCEAVKEELNQGTFVETDDVNNVANLIKVWFRELPTKVLNEIPIEMFPVFQEKAPDGSSRAQVLVEMVKEPNKSIMLWLVELCAKVMQNEQVNRMSAKNLAIVFGPNLYEKSSEPLVMLGHTRQVTLWLEDVLEARAARTMEATKASRNDRTSASLERELGQPASTQGDTKSPEGSERGGSATHTDGSTPNPSAGTDRSYLIPDMSGQEPKPDSAELGSKKLSAKAALGKKKISFKKRRTKTDLALWEDDA